MALPNFSVKRPVTVIMCFLGVVLFGLISWSKLPQELYPPITYPQLSVVTFYKDAAPEEMELLITKPVEEAVGTVSGVRRISSTSKEEASLVVAEFSWGTNMDFAALGVREKIDLIKESLPRAAGDPIVMKFNPFELPLMVLNITAAKTSPGDLQRIVKKVVKNELEKANGVAAVNITGGVTPEVLIEIDQDKLMSKEVALNDVVETVSKANLNYPAGTIEESFYEYLIRTMGEFTVVDEINDVVIEIEDRTPKREFTEYGPEDVKKKQEERVTDIRLIQLKDIAVIKNTFKDRTSISRFNGNENISVSLLKQADTNTLTVANNVRRGLERLKSMIPEDVRINVVYDQSSFVNSAISGVRDAALQGGILAFLVLLVFLKNIRGAAVVALNIPISIMAVFSLMYFSGITMNMISLGGLALGVGMLVDNGIVVIENIYRHFQREKRPPKEASVEGANEVSGPIVGSTLTTIAVFLPMVFVIGIAGQLFRELAFTVTFSLLGSLAVALTLIPILGLKAKKNKEAEASMVGGGIASLQDLTQNILKFFLHNKFISLLAVFGVFVLSCLLITVLDIEFLPRIDQGQYMIKIELPPGTRLKVTDDVAKIIESHLSNSNDVLGVTVNIGSTKEKKGTALLETMGPHEGRIIVNLKPLARWNQSGEGYRLISTSESLQRLKNSLKQENLRGAEIEYVLQDSVFKSAFQTGAPVVIEIKGQDLDKLRRITADIEASLNDLRGIYSVRDSLIDPAPEVKINIFKEKATAYNLTTNDIAVTAQTAVKGHLATKFKKEGDEIDIRVRLRKVDRDNMAKVRRLGLRSPLGIDVPLAEVAYFSLGEGPSEIKRQDQERIVVVSANIFKRSFKEIADKITALLKEVKLPSGYSVELTGEREQIEESFNSLKWALVLSLVLVFMIMASQFESLWQPFVIMFTIPLSIIGVVLILILTQTPLSVMVILGVIILGGIVVNNGIVLIDYTNLLRKQGMTAEEAVLTASSRRLRPIIMTALTTILALIPLALALNEGAELQQPMAIAVIGGLTVSTFLSLIVIPTIYLGLEGVIVFVKSSIFGVREKVEEISEPPEPPDEEIPPEPEAEPPPEPPVPERPKRPKGVPSEDEGGVPSEDEGGVPDEAPEGGEVEGPEVPAEPEKEVPPEPKVEPPPEPKAEGRGNIPLDIWDSLTERHHQLILYVRENRKITRKDYADKFNISVPTAARDLKLLSEKGILVAKGPAAVGRYYVLA